MWWTAAQSLHKLGGDCLSSAQFGPLMNGYAGDLCTRKPILPNVQAKLIVDYKMGELPK